MKASKIILFLTLIGMGSWMHSEATRLDQTQVRILTIDGVINPLTARYFKREVQQANRDRAQAVILELNTPGGLETSMREMTQTILSSPIPVIVYVTPQGARAASAGMFITIAAHIAVMAPGTNIGAAHPVSLGSMGDQKPDEVMKEKVLNDAAALARSIARERERNVEWVNDSVRKSVSITAHEAAAAEVIDFVAKDRKELLDQLHGRRVELPTGTVRLQMKDIHIAESSMHFPEKLLQVVSDPNIAYLLITIGFIGIMAELFSPGLFFPGIAGAISLLLGLTAMGSFPIGWAGLVFLLIGVGLLFFEAQQPGIGILGIAGLATFILGSLMLYTPLGPVSPALPAVAVSPWTIGIVTAVWVAFILWVMRSVFKARRIPVATGRPTLVGKSAIALTDLSPRGVVKLDHESWSAMIEPGATDQVIHADEKVKVVDLEGAILKVRKNINGEKRVKKA
jgi:membrane-bound serine protease (ClpP class)